MHAHTHPYIGTRRTRKRQHRHISNLTLHIDSHTNERRELQPPLSMNQRLVTTSTPTSPLPFRVTTINTSTKRQPRPVRRWHDQRHLLHTKSLQQQVGRLTTGRHCPLHQSRWVCGPQPVARKGEVGDVCLLEGRIEVWSGGVGAPAERGEVVVALDVVADNADGPLFYFWEDHDDRWSDDPPHLLISRVWPCPGVAVELHHSPAGPLRPLTGVILQHVVLRHEVDGRPVRRLHDVGPVGIERLVEPHADDFVWGGDGEGIHAVAQG
mmetsp:Transcript_28970/g.72202  ORF Transcript_28970/g.72202 Transcript_28970/m.72202 type:complete len:267 (+) Transcript_28970:224-1024(+)